MNKQLKMLKEEIVFIAENEKPIGYATIRESFRDGSEFLAIAVLEEYHNKGIGTELLKRLIIEAKKWVKEKLYSYCWHKNFPSIAFHNKNQFYIIELDGEKFPGGELAILLCKEL